MKRLLCVLPGLIVVLLAAGCSSNYRVKRIDYEQPSPWPYYAGSAESTGAVAASGFSGKLDVVWERREPGKPSGPLTLQHNALFYPSARKRIKVFDRYTGEYLGRIKSKAPSQTGLVMQDSIGCFAAGPTKFRFTCANIARGKRIWQRHLKDASDGSILVGNRLIVGSTGGVLSAFELDNGAVAWRFEAEDERFSAPPTYSHGMIFQPGDKSVLYAVSPDDGTELFRT